MMVAIKSFNFHNIYTEVLVLNTCKVYFASFSMGMYYLWQTLIWNLFLVTEFKETFYIKLIKVYIKEMTKTF